MAGLEGPTLLRVHLTDDGIFMKSARTALPGWLYPLLSLAVIYAYWVPRLTSGFWVDEAGSYWIAHRGFAHVWESLRIYPGQSLVYMHLSSLFAIGGPFKEAAMRLPSVAAALVAAWLLFLLTERIAGPGSGYLAVIPFLSAGAIVFAATNARPYALGSAVMLASFLSLREWVHTGSARQYVIYGLTSSAVVYLHYLFGLIFLPQALYLLAAHLLGPRGRSGAVHRRRHPTADLADADHRAHGGRLDNATPSERGFVPSALSFANDRGSGGRIGPVSISISGVV